MHNSFADIREKAAPALRGMGMLILALFSFIVALWILMAVVRVLVPAG
ncbi:MULTISPECIES: hypothetical protein [unclassified Adlercreutzia]|nr:MULTISPECIES: hypothetical protein [unclassified Adlercreutzia]